MIKKFQKNIFLFLIFTTNIMSSDKVPCDTETSNSFGYTGKKTGEKTEDGLGNKTGFSEKGLGLEESVNSETKEEKTDKVSESKAPEDAKAGEIQGIDTLGEKTPGIISGGVPGVELDKSASDMLWKKGGNHNEKNPHEKSKIINEETKQVGKNQISLMKFCCSF